MKHREPVLHFSLFFFIVFGFDFCCLSTFICCNMLYDFQKPRDASYLVDLMRNKRLRSSKKEVKIKEKDKRLKPKRIKEYK